MDKHIERRNAPRPDLGAAPDYFQIALEGLAILPDVSAPDTSHVVLEQHYGLSGSLNPLSSEVERTFDAKVSDGHHFILKTSTRPQAIESFRFQSAAIAALDAAGDVLAPNVIPTRSGGLMFEEDGTAGYLQSKIDGVPLHKAPRAAGTLYAIGAALARLNLALSEIDAPATRRPVLWNIACWPRLNELEQFLPEGPTADRVKVATAGYMASVAPYLDDLNWQTTHNDPSPFNMILTDKGVAFIDFGDGGWNPRIQDLAIAAGHFVMDPTTPLGGSEYVIAGYASQTSLSDLEARLLVGMIRARHCALILINNWRARLFPADAQYILKNVGRAEQGLSILAGLDTCAGETAVHAAMRLTRP